MKRYSAKHEAEIVALYEEGLGLPRIEQATGTPVTSAWKILQRNGVQIRDLKTACANNEPPGGPLDVVDLTRTVWLHEQGLTYAQIGELIGLGRLGVKARIKTARNRLGYTRRNAGTLNRTRPIPRHVLAAVERWARVEP